MPSFVHVSEDAPVHFQSEGFVGETYEPQVPLSFRVLHLYFDRVVLIIHGDWRLVQICGGVSEDDIPLINIDNQAWNVPQELWRVIDLSLVQCLHEGDVHVDGEVLICSTSYCCGLDVDISQPGGSVNLIGCHAQIRH